MFIVEDGSVVAGANSYAALDFAVAYFDSQGRAAEFAGTPEQQQGWLVQGTMYIDIRWGNRFPSTRFIDGQPLGFPRLHKPGVAWMPEQLVRATCEYAVRAKLGPLAPDPKVDASGHSVVMTGRKVGPIERTFAVVGDTSAPGMFRSYPTADALMGPLLGARKATLRVIR